MDIMPVPADLVPAIWPSVLPLIERGVEASRGDRLAPDYFDICASGAAQLWLIGKDGAVTAICIAEMVQYPRRRVALVDLIAGDGLSEWLPLLDATVGAWGRARGASAIQTGGRPGWSRVTKQIGYRTIGIVIEKDLAHV